MTSPVDRHLIVVERLVDALPADPASADAVAAIAVPLLGSATGASTAWAGPPGARPVRSWTPHPEREPGTSRLDPADLPTTPAQNHALWHGRHVVVILEQGAHRVALLPLEARSANGLRLGLGWLDSTRSGPPPPDRVLRVATTLLQRHVHQAAAAARHQWPPEALHALPGIMGLIDLGGRTAAIFGGDLETRFGLRHSDVVERPRRLLEVVSPHDRGTLTRAWRRIVRGQRVRVVVRCRATSIDGRARQLRVVMERVAGGVAMIAVDVTGDRPLGSRLDATWEEEIAAAHRAKTTLRRFSHNVRTPLQTMLGFLRLIDRRHVPDAVGGYLDHMTAATRHLQLMAGDLSRQLESARDSTARTAQDLTVISTRIVGWMQPLAMEHDVDLTVVPPSFEVEAWGSEHQITEVLTSLVANAVRYNEPRGGVEVRPFRRGHERGVAVRDSGPGLEPDELVRAFSPFTRLGADAGGGSGLGLPLSRSLAESMGGRIEAESRVGEGSEFRLVLPAVTPPTDLVTDPPGADQSRH